MILLSRARIGPAESVAWGEGVRPPTPAREEG